MGTPPEEAAVPRLVLLETEILSRGPVHEAYAVAGTPNPAGGQRTVTSPPPRALVEVPPGPGTAPTQVWVPGYWDHDAEENAWIWVSGCWRDPPLGRGWLPGYWAQVRTGQWRRVSGTWWGGDGTSFMLEYAPAPPPPPASLGTMPPKLDPKDTKSAGMIYTPSAWEWNGNRYTWMAGRLARFANHQIWQEPRQLWTPAGYLPVSGYLDHRLGTRGVAYSPLRLTKPLPPEGKKTSGRVSKSGTFLAVEPGGVWNANSWIESSWRDRQGLYYFGDYYHIQWRNLGLMPAREGKRRYGDAWLQAIEEQAGLTEEDLRRVNWQHTERVQGKSPPPGRVVTLDKALQPGEQSLVLPSTRLDASDPARVRLATMALEVSQRMERLAEARQEMEKNKLEGRRVQLKEPVPMAEGEVGLEKPLQPSP